MGRRFGVNGTGSCPNGDATCYVAFFGQEPSEPNYQVIQTDYTSYSVVYSCQADYAASLWYLSRTPTVSEEQMLQYHEIAARNLPNFDFNTMAEPDVQGSMCDYNTDPTMLFLN